MIRGAEIDPPEVSGYLWREFAGAMAFDVGSNCGQSVGFILQSFDHVHAFEPAAESYEVLMEIVGREDRASAHNCAVSDHEGEVDLAAVPAELEMGQLVSTEHWGYTGTVYPQRTVPCVTLDGAMKQYGVPDLVKIDTEGHEVRILKGAAAVLAAGQTDWLIEFHSPQLHDDCKAMLEAAGCEVETVRHPHYSIGSENWFRHGWIRGLA